LNRLGRAERRGQGLAQPGDARPEVVELAGRAQALRALDKLSSITGLTPLSDAPVRTLGPNTLEMSWRPIPSEGRSILPLPPASSHQARGK